MRKLGLNLENDNEVRTAKNKEIVKEPNYLLLINRF